MKKRVIVFLLAATFLLITSWVVIKANKQPTPLKKAIISGQEFYLENAINPTDQYRGLSFRAFLCEDCGMIFIFPNYSERSFVMRNMYFPLDIIFIENNTIKTIYKNLPPEGLATREIYKSLYPVDKVLEINGGQADKLGLKVGDRIKFE